MCTFPQYSWIYSNPNLSEQDQSELFTERVGVTLKLLVKGKILALPKRGEDSDPGKKNVDMTKVSQAELY